MAEVLQGAVSGAGTGASVGGGWGALAGAVIGGAASLLGGSSANSSNLRIARENRAWQERMANTAHQREIKDLRAAGLNPLLSGTGGQGADTPAGATAQMLNIGEAGVRGAQSGFQSAIQQQLSKSQIDYQHSASRLADGQFLNTNEQTERIRQLLPFEKLKLAAEAYASREMGRNAGTQADYGSPLKLLMGVLPRNLTMDAKTLGNQGYDFFKGLFGFK